MPPNSSAAPDLLAVLAGAGVPFVVIGGHAVNFHGYVRTTEDTDIVFERTPESEIALLNVLKRINACWISNERDPETGLERLVPVSAAYIRVEHLMMLCTDLGFLDIYDFVPGFADVPVPELFAESIALDGVRFVSLAWLRKLKARAGRHKDLDDLEHLPEEKH